MVRAASFDDRPIDRGGIESVGSELLGHETCLEELPTRQPRDDDRDAEFVGAVVARV